MTGNFDGVGLVERATLGVTPGDLAGIGPDVLVRGLSAFVDQHGSLDVDVLVYAPREAFLRRVLGRLSDQERQLLSLLKFRDAPWPECEPTDPGTSRPAHLSTSRVALCLAVHDACLGLTQGIWTGPVPKAVFDGWVGYGAGHTETMALMTKSEGAARFVWAGSYGALPLTSHVPHRMVADALCVEDIVRNVAMASEVVGRLLGRPPRMVMTGLNPHVGQTGSYGVEEQEILCPALEILRGLDVQIDGPMASDVAFRNLARSPKYDFYICPTHDQALTPIKAVAFERAVNVSIGLPFLRVGPTHGPAYAHAAAGDADASSALCAFQFIIPAIEFCGTDHVDLD
jgi:4-hydroxythreonine-4-phosphate dehydrogenase